MPPPIQKRCVIVPRDCLAHFVEVTGMAVTPLAFDAHPAMSKRIAAASVKPDIVRNRFRNYRNVDFVSSTAAPFKVNAVYDFPFDARNLACENQRRWKARACAVCNRPGVA